MSDTKYDVKRLDHLGIISGFCKEIGLNEWIDSHFPKESHNSHITNGQLFIAMLLNGLGFVSRTLHVYPEYFKDIPTERLLGAGVQPEHINDDVLGRFLDNLYEKGVSSLYQELAYKVVKHLDLPCRSLNLDATSFHVDGEYHQDIDAQTIHLTQGYSRDHRPDLNQVVLNLITENKAGIPLYMKACSGNKIEALLMIMTSCLMIYASVEHQIRKVLQENNAAFPDMTKKPTQKPTAKWVFFCFQGISVLTIDKKHQVVTNMMDRQRILLDCFGRLYWEFYS